MKLFFLFLTIDDLHFPQIWENFFLGYSHYSVFCHAKYPNLIKTKWLRDSVIQNLVPTQWGYFTNAYIELLKAAKATISRNEQEEIKFIFVSESCIPIKSFSELWLFFSKDPINTSYLHLVEMNDINIRKSNLTPDFFTSLPPLIKHSGWFCLSHHHLNQLLQLPEITLTKFHKILAGDEHLLSLIYDSSDFKNYCTTFANWDYAKEEINTINLSLKKLYEGKETSFTKKEIFNLRKRKSLLGKHPETIFCLTDKNQLSHPEAFFYRKFDKKSNLLDYYKMSLLTVHHLEEFEKQGYTVVENILSSASILAAREEVLSEDELQNLLIPDLQDIFQRLLGSPTIPSQIHWRLEGGFGIHTSSAPLQGFVALMDQFGICPGGLKGFHYGFQDYFSKGLKNVICCPAGSLVVWNNLPPHATSMKFTASFF